MDTPTTKTQQLKDAAKDAAKSAADRIQKSTTNERLAAGAVALGVAAGAAVTAYKVTKAKKKPTPRAKKPAKTAS